MIDNIYDKAVGCFLGLIAGDALGGPVEFLREDEIKKNYGLVKEMVGGGWLNLKPGEFTDDSEMAILTAKSLVEKGKWEPEDVARRFVDWYSKVPKDVGATTAKALSYIRHGIPWHQAGEKVLKDSRQSAGNGSLMRCAPVAIWGHKLPVDEIVKISFECSKITHADKRCLLSCATLNLAIVSFLQGKNDKNSVVEEIIDYIRKKQNSEEVIKRLKRAQDKDTKPGTSGFVLDTLEIAFHALLHTNSFEEAVVWAVNLGGDTDTQGAVTGALCGAYYGFAAIPSRWLEKIKDIQDLKILAKKLGELSHGIC